MTEEERDAHLREALRHAPDAQLQPPPQLSGFILNEARAKARDATPPSRPRPGVWATAWQWLARPSVATGLAGVIAATLVGMMWWGRPMDEAVPQPPEPAAAAQPKFTPAPVEEAQRRAPEPARAAALRKSAPAADKALPTAPAPTAPAPVQAPAPALAAEAKTETLRMQGGAVAPATAADTTAAKASPQRELSELRQRSNEAEARPSLARLRAAITSEPARWAWQRDDTATHDMTDTVYAWLAQLDTATGDTWELHAARDTTAPPPGHELRLLRDGRVLHRLWLTEHGASWEREQVPWQAELPPPVRQALEASAP